MTPELITFAIGDIHGNFDALVATIAACRQFADGRPTTFVLLGDYIDRGPNSKGVVDFLMNWEGPERLICLKGNHEDMLVHAVSNPGSDDAAWLANGGSKTLLSYGALQSRQIPRAATEWMKQLPLTFDDGLRFYCHAGVDPTRPLDLQTEAVLMYSKFTYPDDLELERYIVHGHTPDGVVPRVRANRINLDTRSGYGGPLSAAAFTRDHKEPLALIVDGRTVELPSTAPARRYT